MDQVNGQWFQVDMRVQQTITQITMDAGASSSDYPRGYQVFVSNDGTSWGSAVASGAGSSALVTISFTSRFTRYVRVVQTATGTKWWSIHELNVLGPAPYVPVAFTRTGWTATASSSESASPPGNALDGNLSTRWSSGIQQVTTGQFFRVDMAAARLFTKIVLDAGSSTNDYPRGYQVFVSNDGSNWGTAIASGTASTAVVTITFSWQVARYIKIAQTGAASSWWSIAELTVFGVGPPRLSRSGWLASAFATCQSDVPGNVLDGNGATRWSSGVPQASSNQWFQVDMRTPQIISQIDLDSGSSSGDYARKYQVFVSRDGTQWTGPIASGNGTSALTTISFPPRTARYFQIKQVGSSSSWWSIHELNVSGPFPIETCTQLVPANATLSGQAQENRYQEDLLRACTGGGLSTCETTVRARANVDFVTAAAALYANRISTGVYGTLLRDREARLDAVRADQTLACNLAAHDADGDFVPDDGDACPGTPPLTPVLANGCTKTQLPTGPDAATVRSYFRYMGLNVDPRCVGVPKPAVPGALGAFRSTTDPALGKAVWLAREPRPTSCPLYYQIEFYLADSTGAQLPGLRTATFPATEQATLPWIAPPSGAVQFSMKVTDQGDRAAWASYEVFTHSLRARAFNLAGQRSAWSDFFTLSHTDCVQGQTCSDR